MRAPPSAANIPYLWDGPTPAAAGVVHPWAGLGGGCRVLRAWGPKAALLNQEHGLKAKMPPVPIMHTQPVVMGLKGRGTDKVSHGACKQPRCKMHMVRTPYYVRCMSSRHHHCCCCCCCCCLQICAAVGCWRHKARGRGGARGGKQLWNGGWHFHEQLTPMHIPYKSLPMRFADDPFATHSMRRTGTVLTMQLCSIVTLNLS